MNRMAVRAAVIGSLLAGGAAGDLLAAKKSPPSDVSSSAAKARPDREKSFREQIEAQLDAQFGPKNAPPKKYENAAHKIRFTAPGSWKPVSGGCAGSIYNMLVRPEVPPRGKDGSVSIIGSIFTVAANPAKSPAGGLDEAVKGVEDELKKNYPAVEFKPVEKATVAGTDARVVLAFMPAKDKDEPKKAERHTVFVRDGKVYQMILYSRVNTIARETTAVQVIAKSFEWTAPAAAAPQPVADKPAPTPTPAGQGDPDGLD